MNLKFAHWIVWIKESQYPHSFPEFKRFSGMLEGTAALKAAEGVGQGYGEDVCFRLGQVCAGADGGDSSKPRFVWRARGRQCRRTWIRNLGKANQVNEKVTVDEGDMIKQSQRGKSRSILFSISPSPIYSMSLFSPLHNYLCCIT